MICWCPVAINGIKRPTALCTIWRPKKPTVSPERACRRYSYSWDESDMSSLKTSWRRHHKECPVRYSDVGESCSASMSEFHQAAYIGHTVGQSPLFYTFDTPWFLIPHSYTHIQCSHFSCDTMNATSATSVKSLYDTLLSEPKDMHQTVHPLSRPFRLLTFII